MSASVPRLLSVMSSSATTTPNSLRRKAISSITPMESITPRCRRRSWSPSVKPGRMYRKVSVTYARVRARMAASSIAGCVSVGFIILRRDAVCEGRWGHRGSGVTPDEVSMPQLCRENRDERLTLAKSHRGAGSAASHQTRHRLRLEQAGPRDAVLVQQRFNVIRRRRGEESGHVRRAIRLLGPLLHDRRNDVPRPAAQHGLFPQTAGLALSRQACRELKDAMIEEGVAGLDSVCQRHPVALRAQEIGGQERDHLEMRGAVER